MSAGSEWFVPQCLDEPPKGFGAQSNSCTCVVEKRACRRCVLGNFEISSLALRVKKRHTCLWFDGFGHRGGSRNSLSSRMCVTGYMLMLGDLCVRSLGGLLGLVFVWLVVQIFFTWICSLWHPPPLIVGRYSNVSGEIPESGEPVGPVRADARLVRSALTRHHFTPPKRVFGGRCVVCLEEMCGDMADDPKQVVLGCGHAFHTECLVPWLVQNQRCPVCRAVVPCVARNPRRGGWWLCSQQDRAFLANAHELFHMALVISALIIWTYALMAIYGVLCAVACVVWDAVSKPVQTWVSRWS